MAEITYSKTAEEITRRLVDRAVRAQFTRNDLGDDLFNEDDMARDALNLALGDDTGCLGDDEMTAENIDVLFVDQQISASTDPLRKRIAELESERRVLQSRYLHDFSNFLYGCAGAIRPGDDPKEVMRRAAITMRDMDSTDLRVGECDCGASYCPYREAQ
ncbi:hypothetical protein DYQ86_16295 [Acidobacteria bacterium AB60]|nr:hypothetical protein DYQ86_16295 [Acidobacteria bacterium AB60]